MKMETTIQGLRPRDTYIYIRIHKATAPQNGESNGKENGSKMEMGLNP